SSRRRHTRSDRDWSSDVCSSDLQDDAFISIRSKDRSPPKLLFASATTQDAVKYLYVIGVPVLLIALATARLWTRRRQQRRPYQRSEERRVGKESRHRW